MKGKFTLKVLEKLSEGVAEMTDLTIAILKAGYGASLSKIDYELEKLKRAGKDNKRTLDSQKLRKRYINFISWLKQDGLIFEKRRGRGRFFSITPKGLNKLDKLRKIQELPSISYNSEKGDNLIIIAFDIPEKEKRKRQWLRHHLSFLGLKMLQKSVWVGKVKLPKEFIGNLLRLRLQDYVEIFEVTKRGSLRHLI